MAPPAGFEHYYDASLGTEPLAQGWDVFDAAVPTSVTGGVFLVEQPVGFDQFSMARTLHCATWAMRFRINGATFNVTPAQYAQVILGFPTDRITVLVINDTKLSTVDGAFTQVPFHDTDLTDWHELYVQNVDDSTVRVWLDGVLVDTIASVTFGFDYLITGLSTASNGVPFDLEVEWTAFHTTAIIDPPEGGGGPDPEPEAEFVAVGTVRIGAAGLTMVVDELSISPTVMTADTVVEHYRAGKGLSTST